MENDGGEDSLVTGVLSTHFAGGHIPQSSYAVRRSGEHKLRVGRERTIPDPTDAVNEERDKR